jgi:signal transduction histidine kinase
LLEDTLAARAEAPGDGPTSAIVSAHEALAAIEVTGRQCLTEMRHLVGLLRDHDNPSPDGAGAAVPMSPPPALDRLGDLLRSVRAAGPPVRLVVNGAPQPLSAGASLTAYRVIQESLTTNTIRHAGQTRATVHLDWSADTLTIQVDDDGAGSEAGPPPTDGSGLAGLRERVRIFDGTLTAGPKAFPGHGWTVNAALPLSPDAPPWTPDPRSDLPNTQPRAGA